MEGIVISPVQLGITDMAVVRFVNVTQMRSVMLKKDVYCGIIRALMLTENEMVFN